MTVTFKEQMNWLNLNRVTYRNQWHYSNFMFQQQLTRQALSPQELVAVQKDLLQTGVLTANHRIDFEHLSHHLAAVQTLSKQSLVIGAKDYPTLWKHIYQPPLVIYYAGDVNLLQQPCVSIVGTRQITNYGQVVVTELAQRLSQKGIATVSGLAAGVDYYAHQGAMRVQQPATIGVIATGLGAYYPASNQGLQQAIAKDHLLLSEYLPTQRARRHHFVMRNRLVAGLSPATLVIEAADQSGSLITANYALQFNREVYALPGRITDRQSVGCNALIEQGAIPINSLSATIQSLEALFQNQHLKAEKS